MHTFTKTLLTLSLTAATTVQAQPAFSCCATSEDHVGRPDDHAPISVMGDHTHAKDGWMVSYRYMQMNMDGMRHGTDRVSSSDVLSDGYTVTPESMTMDMHMFGLMYAPTDKLTLMLMGNYTEIEMDHRINPGAPAMLFNVVGGDTFTTETSGFGDLKLGGLYRFFLEGNKKAHAGLSLSLPTGSIDEKDNTPKPGMPPSFPKQQLPAPMQLGSGTYDLLPSLTFVQQFDNWSYGAQANAVIRLESENDHGYRLGNVFGLTTWAGYNLNEWIGLNTGLNYTYTSKLKGDQDNIGLVGPAGKSVTTAYNDNYGGERVDAIFGINLYVPKGPLKGQRIAIDVRLPLWQDLNGYQLETDSVVTIGWQMAF
ncbi:MAG: transporter [Opitutaceae bacterium]